MSRNKGKPAGANKPEGTGTPTGFKSKDLKKDDDLTDEFTDDDKKIADHIRSKHPNRNADKDNATNAHGYRN